MAAGGLSPHGGGREGHCIPRQDNSSALVPRAAVLIGAHLVSVGSEEKTTAVEPRYMFNSMSAKLHTIHFSGRGAVLPPRRPAVQGLPPASHHSGRAEGAGPRGQ